MKKSILLVFFNLLIDIAFAQLPVVPAVNGNVNAVIPDGSGGLFIAGAFTQVAGQSRSNLARINADGTLNAWNPVGSSEFSFGELFSLTIATAKVNPTDASPSTLLFVAGGVTNFAGREVLPAYVIQPTMSNLTCLSGSSIWSSDYDLQLWSVFAANNKLYVGGSFTNTSTGDGVNHVRHGLAVYDLNATTQSTVLVNYSTNPSFDAVPLSFDYYNNAIYVGGFFSTVNGTSRPAHMATISTTDGSLGTWNPSGFTFPTDLQAVIGIKVHNSYLYAVGNFTAPYTNVASFNLSDGSIRTWNVGIVKYASGGESMINAIQFFNDDVILGGSFDTFNGSGRKNFAIVSESTAALKSFTNDLSNQIIAMTNVQSSQVVAGGYFANDLVNIVDSNWNTQLPQTITFNALSAVTFGSSPFNLSASSTSGLTVSFASSDPTTVSISGTTATILKAGSVNITATQAGNASFTAATPVIQPLTINKESQTVSFNVLPTNLVPTNTYNLGATASSGLTVTYSSSNLSVATIGGNILTIIGNGTANITATQAGNSNFSSANAVQPLSVNVTKTAQSITWSEVNETSGKVNLVYNGLANTIVFNGNASSGLPITYVATWGSSENINDVFTINNSYGLGPAFTVSGVTGMYPITVTASQNGNATYAAAAQVSKTYYIKFQQYITGLTDLTADYGTANLTLNAKSGVNTITYAIADTSVVAISGGILTYKNAGSTSVTASQVGNIIYTAATDVTFYVTVNQVAQNITFNKLDTVKLGVSPITLSATSNTNTPITYSSGNSYVGTIVGNVLTISATGDDQITASQVGTRNYLSASVNQSIHVSPQPKGDQTITFAALPIIKFAQDSTFNLGASSDSGFFITYTSSDETVATIAGSTVTIVGVGSTTITASQGGNSTYNAATPVQQTLTVDKANQTITFAPFQVSNSFNLIASSTSGLIVTFSSSNTSVAAIEGNIVTIVSAGTSVITASQSGNSDFNPAVNVTQTLTAVVTGIEPIVHFLSLFPNPTIDYLNIVTDNNENKNVIIYQMNGQVVENLESSEQQIKLSVVNYHSGLYLINVVSSKGNYSLRFEKQ